MSISTTNSQSRLCHSQNQIQPISKSVSPPPTPKPGYSKQRHNEGYILITSLILISGILITSIGVTSVIVNQIQEHNAFTQFLKIHHNAMSGFVAANAQTISLPITREPVSKSSLIAHLIPYRNVTFSTNGTLSLVKTNTAVYSISENPPYRAIYRRDYTANSTGQIQTWGRIEKF